MPAAGYTKHTFTGPRPWENTDAAPFAEIPDQSRGEIRFAAEVALAQFHGQMIPTFAQERAVQILGVVARS